MSFNYPTAMRNGPPTELDRLFDACEVSSGRIARYTMQSLRDSGDDFAFRLLAPAIDLVMATEALFDAGHFFACQVLHRAIFERIGCFYLIHNNPERYLPAFNANWPKDTPRPEFRNLLREIPTLSENNELILFLRKIGNEAIHADSNSIIHLLDPLLSENEAKYIIGSRYNAVVLRERAMTICKLAIINLLTACKEAYPFLNENDDSFPQGGGEQAAKAS